MLFAVVLAGVFVARSAFAVGGETFFSLFDDEMISMRYARNLAAGHGLVWNPGEAPVEGYSNLLWTLWMAVLHGVGLAPSKVSLLVMVTGMAILGSLVLVTFRLAEELGARGDGGSGAGEPGRSMGRLGAAPALAGWLLASSHDLLFWTMRGVEVGLVALEVTAAVLLALRLERRWRTREAVALAVVMGLGVLTRDDTLPAWGCVCAHVVMASPGRRGFARGAGLFAVVAGVFAAHGVFRELYYGAALPNTYALKVAGVPLSLRLGRGATMLGRTAVLALPLSIVLAARGIVGKGPRGRSLLAAVVAAQGAYSLYVGGDAFEDELLVNRFLCAGLPCLFVLAAMGLARLSEVGSRGEAGSLEMGTREMGSAEGGSLGEAGSQEIGTREMGSAEGGSRGEAGSLEIGTREGGRETGSREEARDRLATVGWWVFAAGLGLAALGVGARRLSLGDGLFDLRVSRIAAVVVAAAAMGLLMRRVPLAGSTSGGNPASESGPRVGSASESGPRVSSALESGPRVGSASESGPRGGSPSESGPRGGSPSESEPRVGSASESGPRVGSASESGPRGGSASVLASDSRSVSASALAGAARRGGLWTACLLGVVVLGVQGPALLHWGRANARWIHEEQLIVRYALALGAGTPQDTTLAVTWAGAIPYFADRRAVDLLGKCDPVVARSPVRGARSSPGHDRWDLDHSLGELRPDVIAQLPETPPDLLSRLDAWGYDRVGPEMFVRRGAGLDRAAVQRAACAIPWDRVDLLGTFEEPLSLWRARFQRECGGAPAERAPSQEP